MNLGQGRGEGDQCTQDAQARAAISTTIPVAKYWVMNADGTNAYPIAQTPYAQHPVWSPDGRRIAYDADADGDGFNELIVEYYGSLPQPLTYTGLDWHPMSQTTDNQPPVVWLAPLPEYSPRARVRVAWGGEDVGPAGLAFYDVQVRRGNGPWMKPYISLPITVTGENFLEGAMLWIDGVPLVTNWLSPTQLTVTLPNTLSLGVHLLEVQNPGGQTSAVPGGLIVGKQVYLPLVLRRSFSVP